MQHAKNKALEQRLEVLTTERDDAKILAKELKVMRVLFCMCSFYEAGVHILLKFTADHHVCNCVLASHLSSHVSVFPASCSLTCSPKPHDHKAHQRCRW